MGCHQIAKGRCGHLGLKYELLMEDWKTLDPMSTATVLNFPPPLCTS